MKNTAIKGTLVFLNTQSKERLTVPAYAMLQERPKSSEEENKSFGIVAYFEHLGLCGEWEQVKRQVNSIDQVMVAKQWIPISFKIQNEQIRKVIEQEVSSLMSSNGMSAEAGVVSSPAKRMTRVRVNEWASGWYADLCFEPFSGLSHSAKKILQLQEQGAFTLESLSESDSWLQDQVKQQEERRSYSSEAGTSLLLQEELGQAEKRQSKEEEDYPLTSLESAVSQSSASIEQELFFEPKSSSSVRKMSNEAKDALAQMVFVTDPNMKGFDALLQFSVNNMKAGSNPAAHKQGEAPLVREASVAREVSDVPQGRVKEVGINDREYRGLLNFTLVRLPIPSLDRINWNEALYAVDSFVPKEIFNLMKGHWKKTLKTDEGKSVNLYSIDALLALSHQGVEYQVNGKRAGERQRIGDKKSIDPEKLSLAAMSDIGDWKMPKALAKHALGLYYERSLFRIAKECEDASDKSIPETAWIACVGGKIDGANRKSVFYAKSEDTVYLKVPRFQADGFDIKQVSVHLKESLKQVLEKMEQNAKEQDDLGFLDLPERLRQPDAFLRSLDNPHVKGTLEDRSHFYKKGSGQKNQESEPRATPRRGFRM